MLSEGVDMTIIKEPIAQFIWENKYRYQYSGKVIDQDLNDTWLRVAEAIAQAEKRTARKASSQAFYRILENFQFLPGGRILAGSGTHNPVTLFNCFVMNIAKDSLPGIFTALTEGALTLQYGGGVGYDFSVIRPRGDDIDGVSHAGPVAFMRIWDTTCNILMSTGARRGAMMGVLRCDHPDIEAFIAAKREEQALRNFNVSVMVTDAFMKAVKQDRDWPLIYPVDRVNGLGNIAKKAMEYRVWRGERVLCRVYKNVKARRLWQDIIRNAYDYAEPGVLFADTINRENNLWYRESINATNPCGEIPLPAYGACNLGAINLTQFVLDPFSAKAKLDWPRLEEIVHIATRFLDNVINISLYPLAAQRRQAIGTRRIGLGITGLADAFIMLNICYGSEASIKLARTIMKRIAYVTWQTSIELAREKGRFPFYHRDYLSGHFVKTLPEHIQQQIKKYGLRNSHHNTIAPTGTISVLANNVTNGIEPAFQAEYDRHVRLLDGKFATFRVSNYALRLWRDQHRTGLPPAWLDTFDLAPTAHLQIQGAMQAYVDNAISKTINIPTDFPFAELTNVYTKAYQLGLKGCTIFRPNPVTGSVLEVATEGCCHSDQPDECLTRL